MNSSWNIRNTIINGKVMTTQPVRISSQGMAQTLLEVFKVGRITIEAAPQKTEAKG